MSERKFNLLFIGKVFNNLAGIYYCIGVYIMLVVRIKLYFIHVFINLINWNTDIILISEINECGTIRYCYIKYEFF